MKWVRSLLVFLLVLMVLQSNSQADSLAFHSSTIKIPNYAKRKKIIAATHAIGYSVPMYILYNTWYKQYNQTHFHVFNDNREWLQMDKWGHAYSAYLESRASMEMWKWAGLKKQQYVWIGGLSGAAYQTVIEFLDAYSEGWGWSWGDFSANVLGSGLLIAQELKWNEQRINLKFSFHKRQYPANLQARAQQLYGTTLASRMLKDYNTQTYWLSANLSSFQKEKTLPAWLNIAVGFGADGLFGAERNFVKDENGVVLFDRRDIIRYRQWYLAPDIDFTRIKTNNKILKTTFFVLNIFKFPTPSLELNRKGLQWNWMHF